ncbi:hypothetical protein SNEBB_007844 [Seison nebaliae]|nr:hypothetical protein SNEBB_007844 [Seison nebaliae]
MTLTVWTKVKGRDDSVDSITVSDGTDVGDDDDEKNEENVKTFYNLGKHPWFHRSMKGHSLTINHIKVDGNRMVTCSSEGRVIIWDLKQFFNDKVKNQIFKFNFDISKIDINWRRKLLYVCDNDKNCVREIEIDLKKNETKRGDSNLILKREEEYREQLNLVQSMNVSTCCNVVLTTDNNNGLYIYSSPSSPPQTVTTMFKKQNYVSLSSCGQYLAICGNLNTTKIWHLMSKKKKNIDIYFPGQDHTYEGIELAITVVGGHQIGIRACLFSRSIPLHLLTLDESGKFCYWNCDINWKQKEDARLLSSGIIEEFPKDTSNISLDMSRKDESYLVATDHIVYIIQRATNLILHQFKTTNSITSIHSSLTTCHFFVVSENKVHCFMNVDEAKKELASLKIDFHRKEEFQTLTRQLESLKNLKKEEN